MQNGIQERKLSPLKDNKSLVKLIDWCGSDKSVVNAARVSFDKDSDGAFDEKRDTKLIQYLADHRHGTPFEHNSMTFLVVCPVFVVRQWHRHRVGWSYNELSRRYTEENIEFYNPSPYDLRAQSETNRQASSGLIMQEQNEWTAQEMEKSIREHTSRALKLYEELLGKGLCREQARMVLPHNLYIKMYATCNLRSLDHFVGLRDHKDAQVEIRKYAEAMSLIASGVFPNAWNALTKARNKNE